MGLPPPGFATLSDKSIDVTLAKKDGNRSCREPEAPSHGAHADERILQLPGLRQDRSLSDLNATDEPEVSRHRLLFKPPERNLNSFRSTKELCQAVYAALEGMLHTTVKGSHH